MEGGSRTGLERIDMTGIYRHLTSYGDPEFSQYMRRAFLASAGFDGADLQRPAAPDGGDCGHFQRL